MQSELLSKAGPPTYKDRDKRVKSNAEKITTKALTTITGKRFVTVRPCDLRNPETGQNLEIDCYNHKLRLAVEYNGIQHYEYPNFTDQSEDEWDAQVRRDNFKRGVLDDPNMHILFIAIDCRLVSNYEIEEFLRSKIPPYMLK